MLYHGMEVQKWKDSWPFLSNDEGETLPTANRSAWEKYFLRMLGGYPKSYQLFRNGTIKYYNMPEARPELFDTRYEPDG
jgi:hypothetical protein